MQEHEKTMVYLGLVGAFIALGKLLKNGEELTIRLIFGRMITGAAVSLVAGIGLIQIPNMPQLAIIGFAAALGILGDQFLELWLKDRLKKK
ncbi:hypothetical protein [Neisseria sp. Ec49-e6-T10]|uniref:hypothetical protein n=1 Tax=Neisseria sp. Ec49-e6-T10 TaxID=3140744 RepID=UPI003EC078D7